MRGTTTGKGGGSWSVKALNAAGAVATLREFVDGACIGPVIGTGAYTDPGHLGHYPGRCRLRGHCRRFVVAFAGVRLRAAVRERAAGGRGAIAGQESPVIGEPVARSSRTKPAAQFGLGDAA